VVHVDDVMIEERVVGSMPVGCHGVTSFVIAADSGALIGENGCSSMSGAAGEDSGVGIN
jgi:hypothetical protein